MRRVGRGLMVRLFFVKYSPVGHVIVVSVRNGAATSLYEVKSIASGTSWTFENALSLCVFLELRYEELNAELVHLSPLLSTIIMPASCVNCLTK